jgi:hypothetical protein
VSQFSVVGKLWPSGSSLDLGTDNNSVTVPPTAHFDRHAANFVTSMDGTHNYQFLFWNTGRHVTNKRHVHWDFSVGGWGIWTATKWYGTPGGNGGPPRVRVDAFSIGGDAPISRSAQTGHQLSNEELFHAVLSLEDGNVDSLTRLVTEAQTESLVELLRAYNVQLDAAWERTIRDLVFNEVQKRSLRLMRSYLEKFLPDWPHLTDEDQNK